jgi:hypothetical protein
LLSPRLHSIRFLFSHPLLQNQSSPALKARPEQRSSVSCLYQLLRPPFFFHRAISSAAMSEAAPVLDAEYMAEIERARRDLRALIASKNCAPIMLRLAYVLSPMSPMCCDLICKHFLVEQPMAIGLADGMMPALTTPRPRLEAPTVPLGSHRSTAMVQMQGLRLPLTF